MSMFAEIIDLLPSADLKAKIKETDHRFLDEELLQIIYKYAPDFDTRLALLERFSSIASAEVSALAKTFMACEQAKYNEFVKVLDGFVYELHVKETPESYDEKYICDSYNAALVCIDRYYAQYADAGAKESVRTRYKIVKRKIFFEQNAFEEDTYAEMLLSAHKTVVEISDYKDSFNCTQDHFCSECKENCPRRCDELLFPCFVQDLALVKYRYHEGKECFGINFCACEACDGVNESLYIVPLDSSTVRDRRFDDEFYDHIHVDLPLAMLASLEEIDETAQKNYLAFVEYIKDKRKRTANN